MCQEIEYWDQIEKRLTFCTLLFHTASVLSPSFVRIALRRFSEVVYSFPKACCFYIVLEFFLCLTYYQIGVLAECKIALSEIVWYIAASDTRVAFLFISCTIRSWRARAVTWFFVTRATLVGVIAVSIAFWIFRFLFFFDRIFGFSVIVTPVSVTLGVSETFGTSFRLRMTPWVANVDWVALDLLTGFSIKRWFRFPQWKCIDELISAGVYSAVGFFWVLSFMLLKLTIRSGTYSHTRQTHPSNVERFSSYRSVLLISSFQMTSQWVRPPDGQSRCVFRISFLYSSWIVSLRVLTGSAVESVRSVSH